MSRLRSARLWASVFISLIISVLAIIVWQPGLILPLPDLRAMRDHTLAPSSLILDRHGQLLYEIIDPHTGYHRPLTLDDVPVALQQAVVATEDASFYENLGFDPRAIARALWLNIRSGRIVSGASTITQQLARNLLIEEEQRYAKSWRRKVRELVLAYHLTRTLSKDEILALYLNETYFGNMAYGVEAASRIYYGKPVGQLDLAECTLLAGLVQSPPLYDPLTNLPAAKERQRIVLGLMVKAGMVSEADADRAHREELRFAGALADIEAPHFCMLVRQRLDRLLGEELLRRGGLRIHTTLDLDFQRAAEARIDQHLDQLNRPEPGLPARNVRNAACIILEPDGGAVRAMVGSPDYFDADIAGAVNACLCLRQPGSAIKPITYAAAFARGYSPATVMSDVRTSFVSREGTPYVPQNYDYRYHGPVSVRTALACSYNVIAVKLLDEIGIDAFLQTARQLGITTLDQSERHGLSLTLGGCEVQLLQLAAAYGVLANGGWPVTPYFVEAVYDDEGQLLHQAEAPTARRVLDERIAYLVTDVLSDREARMPAFGQGSPLELSFPSAVKTGTTTDWRDNWTVGYSREYVVGVWVGNADGTPMERVSGLSGAAPIWNGVMRAIHRVAPPDFCRAPGLVEATVCAESGLLPNSACYHHKTEIFLAENLPSERCDMHKLVAFDVRTGQPAGDDCPPDYRTLRRVTYWPAEALLWAKEQGLPLPPAPGQGTTTESLAAEDEGTQEADSSAGEHASLQLVWPDHGSRYRLTSGIPQEHQQLQITARCDPVLRAQTLSLWVDGNKWYTWWEPPYRVLWPLRAGTHEFRLTAQIEEDTITSAPVRITVYGERERTTS